MNFQISAYFDSINKIPDMIKTAYNLGYSGFVLTDHETVAGHIEVLQTEKELKDKGVIPQDFKCGLGNEIYLVDNRDNIERYWHYILIAKNTEGCQALRELSSIAWYHSFTSRGMTRVPTERKELEMIVKKYPNSLIATNASLIVADSLIIYFFISLQFFLPTLFLLFSNQAYCRDLQNVFHP